MKKTLSILTAGLLGISSVQAAVTLVSGFSRFGQDETAASDLGSQSLTLSLGNATRNSDGTFTTNPADNTKTALDVSSLGLSGATGGNGYTFNINFQQATDLGNLDSLFCMYTTDSPALDNSIVVRYETGDKIGIADKGSSTSRPGSALSTAIDFNNPFSVTVSVQAGGDYTIFVTAGNGTQALSWSGKTHNGNFDQLFVGSWATLSNYQSAATVSGMSFWEGAATQEDLQAIINVPEPATAFLSLLGLGAASLRRRRK